MKALADSPPGREEGQKQMRCLKKNFHPETVAYFNFILLGNTAKSFDPCIDLVLYGMIVFLS